MARPKRPLRCQECQSSAKIRIVYMELTNKSLIPVISCSFCDRITYLD